MHNEIYFGLDLISKDDLQHEGKPKRSGRYPWGSGEDPYHHGADAPGGGKKRKSNTSSESKGSLIKRYKDHKEKIKKAKQEEAERISREEHERLKQEAMNSGDPRRLAPFVRDLSDDELKKASERLRLENDFANKLNESAKYNVTAADRVNAKLKKLNEYTSTGIDTWNNFAKIANVFMDADEQLPLVGAKKNPTKMIEQVVKTQDNNQKPSGNPTNKPTSKPKNKPTNKTTDSSVSDTNNPKDIDETRDQREEPDVTNGRASHRGSSKVVSATIKDTPAVYRNLYDLDEDLRRSGIKKEHPDITFASKREGLYKREDNGVAVTEPFYVYSDEKVSLAKRKKIPKLKK